MSNTIIIDDSNWQNLIGENGVVPAFHGGGEERFLAHIPATYGQEFAGAIEYDADRIPLIPRSEWPDRIREMEKTRTRLSDICDDGGLKTKNQQRTSFCHAFSPAYAIEAVRAMMGLPYVEMSPSSIANPITNYRDRGQWIGEDLQQIIDVGCASVDFVPQTCVGRSCFKSGWEANAAKYKVTECWRLEPRNFDQVGTLLLSRTPICVGYNFWKHAVTLLDLILLPNGSYAVLLQNSWGEGWSNKGRGILSGNKMIPDEAYAILDITYSEN